jgi:flagellar basal-body rod modification protein FlgD
MAVSSVGESTGTPEIPNEAPQGTLDREAFLKLLVAQLSHQDPLQPMEGTEFVTQLAQFTAVEQQIIQSGKLDLISLQMKGLSNNEAAGLVGKHVTIRGSGVAFDGVTPATASVTLAGAAEKVTVNVRGPDGEVVRTMELPAHQAGPLPITWDGKTDEGGTAAAGTYTFDVEATDKAGEPVDVTQDVSGTVVAVNFDKGYPELVLDSGVRAPISDLVSVETGAAKTAGGAAQTLNTTQLAALLEQIAASTQGQ